MSTALPSATGKAGLEEVGTSFIMTRFMAGLSPHTVARLEHGLLARTSCFNR